MRELPVLLGHAAGPLSSHGDDRNRYSAGAYAEYVAVSSAQTFRLPEGCGYDVGALVEPLAIGLHAVDTADIAAGDNVLIVGAGPVGLAIALWSRHVGARSVVVSDPVAVRRESAGQFGATGIIDPGPKS